MSGLVEDIKESFWEQDDNLVENSIIMGKSEVRFIPVAMMNNSLTPDKKSLDIGKILLAHTAMSMGYKYKSSIEPLISSITQMLATMNEGDVVEVGSNFIPRTDKHGKILETNRPLEQTRKHLEGTISAILYNDYHNKSKVFKKYTAEEKKKLKELQNDLKTAKEFKDEELIKSEISKLGKTLDLNTIVTGLNRWTYTVGLGFPNLISPVVNLAYGLVSNLTYSASSKYVTDANMIKGMGMMMGAISRRAVTKADAKNLIKIYGFMDALGLLTHIVDSAYNEETKITKLLVMFQTKAEYINQGSLMIGILKTLTMKDKNGNTVPIWDAFTINENNALVWNTDKMGEPNIEFMGDILVSKDGKKLNISRLGAVIKSEVSKVHGDYESIMVGKRDPFFKLVALFKTWLPEAAHHRFGKTWFNPSTQTWEKGRYRSIFSSETESGEVITPGKAMKEIALSILKLSQKNSFSGYSEADRTNMARNIREFQFIALLTSVALLLSSATKDDEDEEYRRFLFMLINILNKTSIDLAFFADPRATLKIFDNAIPSFTLIARTADIFDIALDTITGDGEIKSGPFKGMNKTLKWAADITPGAAGAIKIYNAGERLFEYR